MNDPNNPNNPNQTPEELAQLEQMRLYEERRLVQLQERIKILKQGRDLDKLSLDDRLEILKLEQQSLDIKVRNNKLSKEEKDNQQKLLEIEEKILFSRLKKTDLSQRPLLKDLDEEGLKNFISEKLSERLPTYLQAHIVYNPVKSKTAFGF